MRNWMKRMCGLRASGRGQTTAEYAIIVALIAISSIGILVIFGNNIRELFSASSRRMEDEGATPNYQQGSQEDVEGSLKEF